MGEPRDWAEGLPEDALTEIVARLPCRTDRGTMAAVCRAWRALVQDNPPPPPPLPWLLMPAADWTRVHCFLSDYRAHHDIDPPLPHSSRCFGSYDGAWLFIAYEQTRTHWLLNLNNNEILGIPDRVANNGKVSRMVMLAATLSAPPNDPGCVGACIITHGPNVPGLRRFAFWRIGYLEANDPEPAPEPGLPTQEDWDWEVEDVVFHGDVFHFLTRGEHILEYEPALGTNMELTPQPNGLNLFKAGGRNYGGLVVRARYLVASGQELLMVVRFAPQPQLLTSSFRVFRAIPPEQNPNPNGDEEVDDDQDAEEVEDQVKDKGKGAAEDEYPWLWSWGELDSLDGRMLFVGRGCSRSYGTAEYPGFTAGIYFLDDRSFYDEEMMFLGDNERQYPCNDNGKWSEGPPPVVQLCPPQNPSNHSPPAWLLP